jgi:hypothetical protein
VASEADDSAASAAPACADLLLGGVPAEFADSFASAVAGALPGAHAGTYAFTGPSPSALTGPFTYAAFALACAAFTGTVTLASAALSFADTRAVALVVASARARPCDAAYSCAGTPAGPGPGC